ncbi:MAG: transglutaminase-like domain-containing protein [bacterium]
MHTKNTIHRRWMIYMCCALLVTLCTVHYAHAHDLSFVFPEDDNYSLPKQIRYSLSIQNPTNRFGKNVFLWIYAPVHKTSNQALRDITISHPGRIVQDEEGNVICVFTLSEMAPAETKIFRIRANLFMSDQAEKISLKGKDNYVHPEKFIESDHPLIIKQASILTRDNPYNTAHALYGWIVQNIECNEFQSEDRGALYAFTKMRGDCTECASLFVALCRAAHIPARMMSGYICHRNCIVTAADFHHWAEFYHEGAWHLVDPQKRQFCIGGENYIATEIYCDENQNPIGEYHRFRFQGEGVRFKVKMN